MGNGEASTPSKSDGASSPVKEQATIHPYPDWAALQAYYGPGVTMPPPYFTAAVASGHAPYPYMWGPQPLMPPYAMPYSAVYTRGVFSHPSVPLVSQSYSPVIAPAPASSEAVLMATPLSTATPAKSSSNKGRGLLKRLKQLDGHTVAAGNGNGVNTSESGVPGSSLSGENGTEASSDGSDGDTEPEGNKTERGSSSEDTPTSGKDENAIPGGETSSANPVLNISSSFLTPEMEGIVPTKAEVGFSVAPVTPATIELWAQDERQLRRERRKQSNRESARRSRLRKQAESEELALKAATLNAENVALRSEVLRLKDDSEKLRLKNSSLKEKLEKAKLSQAEDFSPDKIEPRESPPICTENLLSRINSSSCGSIGHQESDVHENSSNKLRQLLVRSPRTDAVVAG